ncbi:MAG: EamA family transporter [Firmicutes bacterium]|nr:EamA family transporter [Bacillota bacterium]
MGVLLAFFAMLCWGLAPLFGKLGLLYMHSITALSIRTLIAATLILSWQIVFGQPQYFHAIPLKSLIFIGVEALLATLVGDLAYFMALKRGNINQVTLIMSSSPLVTMLAAYVFLGERATVLQIIGAVLIVSGLVLVGIQPLRG